MRLRNLPELIEPRELFYPSNLLTLSRLLLVVPTLASLRRSDRRRLALALLALAMFTDAVDGPIARARGEVSRLGELLDPVADKLMIDGAAIILSQTRGFPWWVTGLLLFRDLGIMAAAVLLIRRRARISTAASMGKLTTAIFAVAALLYLADGPRSGKPALYLALVPFALSFVQYGRRFLAAMQQQD